jgi:sugar/nucleoside kinase (ribokinase family)
MGRVKKIGVIGTMVWDTIHGRRDRTGIAVEEWGGIAYALSALEAGLEADWEIVPLVKVGRDLAPRANEFLRELSHRSAATRFMEVNEPNNRVTLRYTSATRRTEQLCGGVPGWSWQELAPLVKDLDAIYVNFISGWELDLETALLLRRSFNGPIYCDLHSLLLGVGANGIRELRALPQLAAWFSCFDMIQLNEEELSAFETAPMELAAVALNVGVQLLTVTLGPEGAVYFANDPFTMRGGAVGAASPIRTAKIESERQPDGDPTGCGDVFGATLIAELLAGVELEVGIKNANRMAGRNLAGRGASQLHYHLRGEIAPK